MAGVLVLRVVVDGGDGVGAFDLVFELVVLGGDVLGEDLFAADLAGLLGGLGAFELGALGDVAGEWVDRGHAKSNIGLVRFSGKGIFEPIT
jgi:hypothetical protein